MSLQELESAVNELSLEELRALEQKIEVRREQLKDDNESVCPKNA